jgi:hypothetical protein
MLLNIATSLQLQRSKCSTAKLVKGKVMKEPFARTLHYRSTTVASDKYLAEGEY